MLETLNDYCKAPHCSTSRNLCHVHLQQVVMKTLRSHDEVSAESDLARSCTTCSNTEKTLKGLRYLVGGIALSLR